MADILAKICEVKRNHVEQCKSTVTHSELKEKLPNNFAVKSFSEALKTSLKFGYGLIINIENDNAEVKFEKTSKKKVKIDYLIKDV